MTDHVRKQLGKYFALHPSTEMKEIFWATAIKNFGLAMVGVFEPIFLFRTGFSIEQILVYYIVMYGLYTFTAPLGARICRKHGYERSMLLSSPFLIIYYLALFALPMHAPTALVVAMIAITIRKTLYWPSYHANFAHSMQRDEEGREISNSTALTMAFTAFAPAIGGAVVTWFGFGALFMVVAALILLSNVPLLRTPEVFEPKGFPYSEMLHRLFNPKALKRFLSFFGYGEQLLSIAVWPIFIAIMVPDLLALGAIVSLAKVANVFVTLYVGRLTDGGAGRGLLRSGTFFTSVSWLVRPMINGPFGVFLIDTYYGVAKNVLIVPFRTLLYSHAKDGDIMVRIVFAEMAISFGRVVVACVALALFTVFPSDPWNVLFVLGALFSLWYALMPDSPTPKDAERLASPSMRDVGSTN